MWKCYSLADMSEIYYYGLAALAYLVTCLSFSVIRWWHTCRVPKDKLEYIWPDRKLQVLVYLQASWLFPYIVNPNNESAWLLEKCYFPATYYFYCGLLLLCFFGTVKQLKHWEHTSWIAASIVIVTMLPLVLDAWLPFSILPLGFWHHWKWVMNANFIIMFIYVGSAMWQVKRWMNEARDANYSNPDDFPTEYAHRVWLAPIIFTPLLWPAFLFDSPRLMAIQNVLLAVSNLVLLLNVMPVWRRSVILSTPEGDEEDMKEEDLEMTQTDRENPCFKQTADEIEKFVVAQKAFLDPHLKIDDVVMHCTYSRTYVSHTFQQQFGGFANYVNHLRIAFYEQYVAEHPEFTKEAAALSSGFSSYNAYYKAKIREMQIRKLKDK